MIILIGDEEAVKGRAEMRGEGKIRKEEGARKEETNAIHTTSVTVFAPHRTSDPSSQTTPHQMSLHD